MKAILFENYGSPDVLQLKDVAKPVPKDDQILVKVVTASANPLDWHEMRGKPFVVRISGGLHKPKDTRLGADVAGIVDSVGKDVTQFKLGDEVFGITGGSFAEYVCVREDRLALKPDNISFAEATAVPVAAFTALQSLRKKGHVQAGQKVLINGASGGVGIYTVQFAKALGTEVTAVCSTRNVEMVRKLGADHVIDYTQEKPLGKNSPRYDLIIDNVGNLSIANYKRGLTANGSAVIIGMTTLRHMISVLLRGKIIAKTSNRKIEAMLSQPDPEDLAFIQEKMASGKIISVIDRCYPLEETAEAIRYLETSRARGKVIITVDSNN